MVARSLNDFVAQESGRVRGPLPWIESIPEWPEILEAYKGGIQLCQIRKWLIDEKGYPSRTATRSRVAYLSRIYGNG